MVPWTGLGRAVHCTSYWDWESARQKRRVIFIVNQCAYQWQRNRINLRWVMRWVGRAEDWLVFGLNNRKLPHSDYMTKYDSTTLPGVMRDVLTLGRHDNVVPLTTLQVSYWMTGHSLGILIRTGWPLLRIISPVELSWAQQVMHNYVRSAPNLRLSAYISHLSHLLIPHCQVNLPSHQISPQHQDTTQTWAQGNIIYTFNLSNILIASFLSQGWEYSSKEICQI